MLSYHFLFADDQSLKGLYNGQNTKGFLSDEIFNSDSTLFHIMWKIFLQVARSQQAH